MVQETTIKHEKWQPNSWQTKPILQEISYIDRILLDSQLKILQNKPNLLQLHAIKNCQKILSETQNKNYFILQGGDCAESLKNKQETINYTENMSQFILELAKKLQNKTNRKIIPFARMGGQMAKPRSLKGDISDAALYRGDLINSYNCKTIENSADATRLIKAYNYSFELINYLEQQKYNLFLCHEAFLLPYEEALVKQTQNQYYSSSTHMLWVGERTRKSGYAHIEFCRGLKNPIGIKIGPSISIEELLKLCDILNPNNELGKLSFIIRMGAENIENKLPILIEAINKHNKKILWLCDPMHGNNRIYQNYKTRFISAIKNEAMSFFNIHKKMHSYAAGIHLELTYENVNECIENEKDININWQNYKSLCDARFNALQAQDFIKFLSTII